MARIILTRLVKKTRLKKLRVKKLRKIRRKENTKDNMINKKTR